MLRRSFLLAGAGLVLAPGARAASGGPLPPRQPGELDIHHLDSDVGNCTLIVGPDGTLIMIDAGVRSGAGIARYARQYGEAIDIFIATHIHPDHIGKMDEASPWAKSGAYRLSGVSDLAAQMPVRRLIDRGFPDYGDRPPPEAPFARNYLAFLRARQKTGQAVEAFEVGSKRQTRLNRPDAFPDFSVRHLAASGYIWTGEGETWQDGLRGRPEGAPVDENLCSSALRLSYGAFSYYAGADLIADTFDGREPWRDIETPVARLAGRTEVATANHHGYFDANGPAFAEALRAQVYILQTWHATHPAPAQLQRLLGAWKREATSDVFATGMVPAAQEVNGRFLRHMKSLSGHVVVRVERGGAAFHVFVLDSRFESPPVKAVFGPYACRSGLD